jgi:hypothetical protein
VSISKNTTVEQAVTYAREKAPDHADSWLVAWTIEDVKEKARENDLELTDEQAREVLRYFEDHYQPVWEASWWVMEDSINQVMERQKKKGVKVHATATT